MKDKRFLTLVSSICLILLLAALPFMTACAPEEVTPTPPEEEEPTAPPAEKPTYHWRMSQCHPPESPSAKADVRFITRVGELSNGRIVIDHHPGAVLGDWAGTFEEVMKGTIELQKDYLSPIYDSRIDLYDLPYLVNSPEQARVALAPDGLLFKKIAGILEDLGIKALACWPEGFYGLALTRLPPDAVDPDVDKGMKIRIWASKTAELTAKCLGYMPTVTSGAESFTAIQSGMVEGGLGTTPEICWNHWRDVINYWIQTNDGFCSSYFIINLDLWKSLSSEDQQILLKAAREESTRQFQAYAENEEMVRQEFRDMGIEVIMPTSEQLDKLAAAVRHEVWPELEDRIGRELMDEVVAYLESL